MNISFFLWYQCNYCSKLHSLFFTGNWESGIGIHSVISRFQDCLGLPYLKRCSYRPRPCKQSLKPLIRKRRLYNYTELSYCDKLRFSSNNSRHNKMGYPCCTHDSDKKLCSFLPMLIFLLLWCQLAKTDFEGAENIPTVPTNVTSIEGTVRFAPRALNSFQSYAHGNLLDTARNINLFFLCSHSLRW